MQPALNESKIVINLYPWDVVEYQQVEYISY